MKRDALRLRNGELVRRHSRAVAVCEEGRVFRVVGEEERLDARVSEEADLDLFRAFPGPGHAGRGEEHDAIQHARVEGHHAGVGARIDLPRIDPGVVTGVDAGVEARVAACVFSRIESSISTATTISTTAARPGERADALHALTVAEARSLGPQVLTPKLQA